jgi:hypothetical protein
MKAASSSRQVVEGLDPLTMIVEVGRLFDQGLFQVVVEVAHPVQVIRSLGDDAAPADAEVEACLPRVGSVVREGEAAEDPPTLEVGNLVGEVDRSLVGPLDRQVLPEGAADDPRLALCGCLQPFCRHEGDGAELGEVLVEEIREGTVHAAGQASEPVLIARVGRPDAPLVIQVLETVAVRALGATEQQARDAQIAVGEHHDAGAEGG